jgi:hypothetical protein
MTFFKEDLIGFSFYGDVPLGTCCACGRDDRTVRIVLYLPRRSPIPGRGWGCVVCELPAEGAVAVICDECAECKVSLRFACIGYPGIDGRIPIEELSEDFRHDISRHSDDTCEKPSDDDKGKRDEKMNRPHLACGEGNLMKRIDTKKDQGKD